jgi:DegV family protein with EDD domain
MPGPIHIITDSSAQFADPQFAKRHNITVLPLEISMDGVLYREGVDLDMPLFNQRAATAIENTLPTLHTPSVNTFTELYQEIHKTTNRILSVHLSAAMHGTVQHAKAATKSLLGRCDIAVVDSQSIGLGLGWMVEEAVRLVAELNSLEDVVRVLRSVSPRIYSIFGMEHLSYAKHNNLMSQSQALVGEIIAIKPFTTIEEGHFIAIEKSRSRYQTADRLAEFMAEFSPTTISGMAILDGGQSEIVDLAQERMREEFGGGNYPVMPYLPSLGCFIGPHAVGVMVLENEMAGEMPVESYEDEDEDLP